MTIENKQKKEFQKIQQLECEAHETIFKGQKEEALTLFGKAEQLFQKGKNFSRITISHLFIRPLSQLLEMNYSWGRAYINMFPRRLKQVYCSQNYSTAY